MKGGGNAMLAQWLGLHDRRSVIVFTLAGAGVAICLVLAVQRDGHARGHLLFAAMMMSWLGSMTIGQRWRYLTKTPRQIVEDTMRRGVRRGFAERLLSLLTIVLGALSIYAQYVA